MDILFALFVWVASCVASSIIASNKGRSGGAWFFLGVVIGPFAILFALIVSDGGSKENKKTSGFDAASFNAMNNTVNPESYTDSHAGNTNDTKECLYCAETIKFKAILCRYCGKEQPEIEGGA